MKHPEKTAIVLALVLMLSLLPQAALAAVGTGWNDDCRGNPTVVGTYGKHNWIKDWETPGADCTSPGKAGYHCSYCGARIERDTQAGGHTWGSWKTTVKATCQKEGQQTRTCEVCGKKETRKTDKAPHSWGEWTVLVPATDFSMGTRSHTCGVCGREKTEDYYPDPTYKRGDKGDGVKQLQEKLNAAGFDCGKADGDFGRRTEAAVKALEKANGLSEDGIAWPGVLKLLGIIAPDAEALPKHASPPDSDPEGGIGGGGLGEAFISLTADLIPSLPYKKGDVIITTCFLTNLTDSDLVIDQLDLIGSEGDQVIHEAWMESSPCLLEAHASVPFQVMMTVGDKDVSDLWGSRYAIASAHAYDDTEATDTVWCEIVFVLQKDKPSIFVITDYSVPYAASSGEKVHIPVKVFNNGSSDLRIYGYDIATDSGAPIDGDSLSVPMEYWSMFGVGGAFEAVLEAAIGEDDRLFALTEAGGGYTDRTVTVTAAELASDQEVSDLDSVYILVTDGTEPQSALTLEVVPDTAQTVFMEGQTVSFTVTARNASSDAGLFDLYIGALDGNHSTRRTFTLAILAAANYVSFNDSYTFSPEDAGNGGVTLTWTAGAEDAGGSSVAAEPVQLSFTVYGDNYTWNPPVGRSVEIVKAEVGPRPDPKGYTTGDIVRYEITVTNRTGSPVENVEVTDPLKGENEDAVVGMIATLAHGESATLLYEHKVTPEEAAAGVIKNIATVAWYNVGSQWMFTADSNEVEVPTYLKPVPPVTPRPAAKDCCVRTLVALGEGREEYTLDYCAEHERVRDRVDALIRAARTEKEKLNAWEQAILIWTDELGEEYDRLLSGRTEAEKEVIRNEKTLFMAAMVCFRDELNALYASDPVRPAMMIAEQLMNRTADLCYETHKAPAARPDSVTGSHAALGAAAAPAQCARDVRETDKGARYTENPCAEHRETELAALETVGKAQDKAAAWQTVKLLWLNQLDAVVNRIYLSSDAEIQRVVTADRVIFGQWLAAREKELKILYPNKPEVVAEVMAMTIRARALDICPLDANIPR